MEKLILLRKELNLTQKEAAKLLGVSFRSYQEYEENEEIFDDKDNIKDKKEHKNVKEQKVETRNEFDIQNGS